MITKNFRDMPLKSKIELIIVSCVLFTSTVAFLSFHFISKEHKKVLYQTVASNLSYSASEICTNLQAVEELANMILSNKTVQLELSAIEDADSAREKQRAKDDVYNILANYLFNSTNQYISYISIVQDSSIISTHSIRINKIPAEIRDRLIQTGKEAEGATIWITDYTQEYGCFLVKELRESTPFSLRPIGTLIINLNLSTLLKQTTIFHSSYEAPSFLLYNDDKNIYSSQEFQENDVENLYSSFKTKDYCIKNIGHIPFFAVKGQIPLYKWDFIAMVSYDSIAQTITVTSMVCIFAMLLSLFTVFLFSSKILHALTRHFEILIKKMHLVGDGIYNFTKTSEDYGNRKDEIGQLHTHFDSMAHKLDTLITENYTNELLKKEAQLKALESQMDPHFLYNTLDSINWRAKSLGSEDIVQITTALGNLLRISLSNTKTPFTLAEEIKLLENYMIIQKLRYPQRLEYTLNIPKEYNCLLIPKFTIQPILENAIRYGLEEMSEICHISICTVVENHVLIIKVKNNGSSFEDHLLEKLETQEVQPHGFGIGLLNIHKRIVLSYGKEYGLKLINHEDDLSGEEYAIVQISLPAVSQENKNSINRKTLLEE